jgi:hypothetical protein
MGIELSVKFELICTHKILQETETYQTGMIQNENLLVLMIPKRVDINLKT